MVFPRFCFLVLAGFWSLAALAADEHSIARVAAPAWVANHEVDLAVPAEAEGDAGETLRSLLQDEQRHFGEATLYRHIGYRLLTQDGVQDGSSLTFEFDPSYERLEFHRLAIYRAGAWQDRLPAQEIKVFQREKNLEDQVYDGRLTASIILADVRVGDVVEYAYSRHGRNPLYVPHLIGSFDSERTRFLHQWRQRLLCPASHTQPRIQEHRTSAKPKIQQLPDGTTDYRWEADDLPAQLQESDVPAWVDTIGWVQFSDFQSWGEVARWAADLFAPVTLGADAPLPEELEKEAAAIEKTPAGAGRIVAALRYVQDNFRYLGIEIGSNTHQPFPVATICERRFGDCKDKANLLSTLLRRLGFDARPALVSTYCRGTIATWLPTPHAFNHAIVRVLWNGRAWWLDPTRTHQGGSLEHVYLPAYGKALVVSPDTQDLEEITANGQEEATIEVANTFRHLKYTDPASLHVRTTYRGAEADEMRETRATTNSKELERSCLNYYARRYPKVTALQPLHFQDDLERNELICDEEYELPGAWEPEEAKPDKLRLSLYPGTLAGRLTSPSTRLRTMPFLTWFPCHVTERFEVELAQPISTSPEHAQIDDPAFQFDYTSERTALGKVLVKYEFRVRAPEVPAERTVEYSARIKHAREQLQYNLTRPKDAPVQAETASPTTTAHAADAKAETVVWCTLGGLLALALFGRWIYLKVRRSLQPQAAGPVLHVCAVCQRTDRSHPQLEFRVAGDGRDYCADHLRRPAASP